MLESKCEEIIKLHKELIEKKEKMKEVRSELEKQIISLLEEAGFPNVEIKSDRWGTDLDKIRIIILLDGEQITPCV